MNNTDARAEDWHAFMPGVRSRSAVGLAGSLPHALIELFRNRPSLSVELLQEALGIEPPEFDDVRAETLEFDPVASGEFPSRHVAVLTSGGAPVLALIVEVQPEGDEDKLYSWPVYTADLRRRLGCEAGVLVICGEEAVARWAAQPILIGFRSVFHPLVVGRRSLRPITDAEEARRSPELAVFSAVAYGDHQDARLASQTAHAAATSLGSLSAARRALYLDMIRTSLSATAREAFDMRTLKSESRA